VVGAVTSRIAFQLTVNLLPVVDLSARKIVLPNVLPIKIAQLVLKIIQVVAGALAKPKKEIWSVLVNSEVN